MFTVQELIAVVEESILKSNNQESKITESILFLKGMSGSRCRHFLNNVCSSSGMNYLEIGAWEGSTSISALRTLEYSASPMMAACFCDVCW